MPIVAVFEGPGFTQQSYEESVQKLTGKNKMSSPSEWPVEGLLVHVAGQGAKGFRVVDVWASEEAFRRFGEKLIPVLREVGIQGEPEIYRSHTVVTA